MDSITSTSAYDDYRLGLVANGYHPHPIGPGSKKPMVFVDGEYKEMVQWQSPHRGMAPSPQPGAGVGVRLGLQHGGAYLVALDWDNESLAIAAMYSFPSAVCKEGLRGFTSFFVAHREIPSKDFRVDKKCAVQVLSTGRQTVLPPSIHPDTGKPYIWSGERTLLDTNIENLPELPLDYIDQIKSIIESANMQLDTEEEPRQAPPADGYDEDGPFAVLNNVAMKDLAAWVPHLDLYKCRRKVGRYASYEAVATWRPSSTGRPNEERKLNLQISGYRGIMDFGVMQGYSPINLIMAARGCDRSTAYNWLSERVAPPSDVEVDFDKIIESAEAPSIEPDADDGDAGSGKEAVFSLLGRAWRFGDVLPKREPMLVQKLIPASGYGYIAGQWGTFKTFVIGSLGVAVAGSGTFAGQDVVRRGAVIMVELEGSNSEARITAAAQAAKLEGALPIALLTDDPPKIILNGVLNPQFKRYCNQLVAYGKKLAEEHGVPLSLITIDPQNKVAGFKDEQSSAEAQVVADAWSYLAAVAGCAVVIVDHYGKNHGAGLRGSSSKETNAHFILGTSEQDKNIFAKRYLEVRKQRNGISGVCTDFSMHEYSVTMKQESDGGAVDVDVSTLVIEWEGGLRPVSEAEVRPKKQAKAEEKSMAQKVLDLIRELMAVPENCVAHDEAPSGYALRTDRLVDAVCGAEFFAGSKNPEVRFRQIRKKLRDDGFMGEDAEAGVVWIALPTT